MKNKNLKEELALYQCEAERKYELALKKYWKLRFKIYDIYDKDTGAVYLSDKDSILLKSKYKEHPIFTIFDIDCIESHRKYTCNMNNKTLLRGPRNYYFGFCYLEDLDVKTKEIINTLEYTKEFILHAKDIPYNEFKYDNILDVKTVLAIIDIIRNSIIINIFFCLMKENNIKDIYIYEDGKNILANNFYKLLTEVEYKIIDIILEQKFSLAEDLIKIINDFIELLVKLIDEIKGNIKEYENDLYIRYRKSREADCVIENIVCIKYAMEENFEKYQEIINKEDLYVLGLNYGSIELIAIADVILKKNNINNITVGNIMKKFRKVYVGAANSQKNIKNKKIKKDANYIIIDENIMTGKTLESAIKYLDDYSLTLLDVIIIKYPTIARIKNIHNVEHDKYMKLLKKIKGMLVPTNYSKLCEYRKNFTFPYMDKLGTFDLYKYNILKNLYKNGEYIEKSAVARLEEYYENIFF